MQGAARDGPIIGSETRHIMASGEILEGPAEFQSESVLNAGGARSEPHSSYGWGYMALLTAFALGMCTAILAVLGWAAIAAII